MLGSTLQMGLGKSGCIIHYTILLSSPGKPSQIKENQANSIQSRPKQTNIYQTKQSLQKLISLNQFT